MPKLSPGLRGKLILLAVLGAVAAGAALALNLRHEARQRRIAACQEQRQAIGRFRAESFDAPLKQMRQMRLNPQQVATLRRVDPEAFAHYVQAYGEQVDKVATAADQLGAKVDAYRAADCLAVP